MSLTRQLWLAIALIMVIAFSGSFVIRSMSAKTYLREQLLVKNLDNATLLAATLSQMPKDPVSVESLIGSQFDAGHYQYIRLVDPRGKIIVDRTSDAPGGAPGWFMALLSIDVAPGVARVQDGWKQYGTLTLASHTGFAYHELWLGSLRLLTWFLFAALVSGIAGTLLLRAILRPMYSVVDQAEAIGARRFITTPEPETLEFQAVVRAMNALAKRVRQMLEEESLRLDQLRREAHYDAVTGMLNRSHFVSRVQTVLDREEASSRGSLVIARLLDLNELNRFEGWALMDTLIKRFAEALRAMQVVEAEWVFGRLNGSDFAVLAPAVEDPATLAHRVNESLGLLIRELGIPTACRLPTAATTYRFGEKIGEVLGRVDLALTAATAEGGSPVQIAAIQTARSGSVVRDDINAWRKRLDETLASGQVRLHSFPVIDTDGGFLHGECVSRMRFASGGEWVPAGEFMPWVSRLGYGPRLDEMVIDLALDRLRNGADDLCINLSAQAMNDALLVHRVASRLSAEAQLSQRLWVEVPEHGVFQHLERFRVLCALLKPVGCKLGIEHVGYQVSRIGLLHDIGLDYLKVDASFVHGLDGNQANQVYLRGLVMIAHSIGLTAMGEGASTEAEITALIELGFDGITGPAVTLRDQGAVAPG